MKIAYTTYDDANNIGAWSGTTYNIAKALIRQGFEVTFIDKLKRFYYNLFKTKSLYYKLINKHYERLREPFINHGFANQIKAKIKKFSPDLIFSAGSLPISSLECAQPIIYWSDATFAGLMNFHFGYYNLNKKTIENGNILEQSALDKSSLILFSSEWAAKTAIDFYMVDSNKIHIVPFGANIETSFSFEDIKKVILVREFNPIKILFTAVSWYNKGGDILINAVRELIKCGYNIELNIIGTTPQLEKEDYKFVKMHGFLRKWIHEENNKIKELYATSHIFIMPTRADAFGIVFCEANAFGLPAIGPDLGGVPTIIKNGINGYLIEHENAVESIVNKFIEIFSDRDSYNDLCLSSYNEYKKRLNWDVSAKKVNELIKQLY